jgi:glycosyltransferase involved in cell wall biosynthesis
MNQNLSVIVPCYNEEKTIKQLITRVLEQEVVREIIVINDASTDNSAQLIKEIQDKRVLYLENFKNLGKGASVKKGFNLATSEYVLIQDADLEYSPEEYPRLLKPLESGFADAVFGSRFLTFESRRALYFWHRVGNKFLTLLSNMFTNIDLTDMETCYKVIRTDFAKRIDIKESRFGLEPELTAKLAKMDARIYEVAISYRGRTYLEGKKITWKDGFSAIRCIIKYNLMK